MSDAITIIQKLKELGVLSAEELAVLEALAEENEHLKASAKQVNDAITGTGY
jgi:hypothetical protein